MNPFRTFSDMTPAERFAALLLITVIVLAVIKGAIKEWGTPYQQTQTQAQVKHWRVTHWSGSIAVQAWISPAEPERTIDGYWEFSDISNGGKVKATGDITCVEIGGQDHDEK